MTTATLMNSGYFRKCAFQNRLQNTEGNFPTCGEIRPLPIIYFMSFCIVYDLNYNKYRLSAYKKTHWNLPGHVCLSIIIIDLWKHKITGTYGGLGTEKNNCNANYHSSVKFFFFKYKKTKT